MKVIVLSILDEPLFNAELKAKLSQAGELVTFKEIVPLAGLTEMFASDEDKIIAADPRFCGWALPNDVIDASRNLRAICLQTTSYSWVDVTYARDKQVTVTNVRGFSTTAVSEWAIMMVLLLARQIPLIIRAKSSVGAARPIGIELTGKTAGVIGLGRIGTAMAERLSGLGMKVQYWSANSSDKNYRKVPLEELMKTSDVILPALARNDQTKGLISDEMIRTMKKTSIFASVVHEVYNHKLLVALAEQGAIYGYGFESGQQDVTSYSGNVWAGPDLAWYTNSSVSANAIQWVDSIISASRGQFPTRVN